LRKKKLKNEEKKKKEKKEKKEERGDIGRNKTISFSQEEKKHLEHVNIG
jgi:hypothetical protein